WLQGGGAEWGDVGSDQYLRSEVFTRSCVQGAVRAVGAGVRDRRPQREGGCPSRELASALGNAPKQRATVNRKGAVARHVARWSCQSGTQNPSGQFRRTKASPDGVNGRFHPSDVTGTPINLDTSSRMRWARPCCCAAGWVQILSTVHAIIG